jgi:hypothetical protein
MPKPPPGQPNDAFADTVPMVLHGDEFGFADTVPLPLPLANVRPAKALVRAPGCPHPSPPPEGDGGRGVKARE